MFLKNVNHKKKTFSQKSENFENIFSSSLPKQKNAILSVLPIEEISLGPALSSPVYFRFQGRSPERDTQKESARKSLCLI